MAKPVNEPGDLPKTLPTDDAQGRAAAPVGDQITAQSASWAFGDAVADHFDAHVRRSVPLYDMGHDLVCRLSDFFVTQPGLGYEIGCSTGLLLQRLAQHNALRPGCRWVGVDREPAMVARARARCAELANVEVIADDATTFAFDPCDMVVAYYTVQFIRPHLRQPLFDRIYECLHWGGAFVLFEKVRGPDARFQDMLTALYDDYKREQGYDDHEIMGKARSLRGVLEPYTSQANLDYLRRAGFSDVMPVMKYLGFEGFLAIK
jgi:tRNA (cmo5U34)-methyltransferase